MTRLSKALERIEARAAAAGARREFRIDAPDAKPHVPFRVSTEVSAVSAAPAGNRAAVALPLPAAAKAAQIANDARSIYVAIQPEQPCGDAPTSSLLESVQIDAAQTPQTSALVRPLNSVIPAGVQHEITASGQDDRGADTLPAAAEGQCSTAVHSPAEISGPHIDLARFAVVGARKMREEYQQAGKNILATLPVAPAAAILISSADAPYDSAAVMCNLAIALADQSDSSVLAIDATPRATLTKELGIQRVSPLTRLLRGAADWNDCIVQTPTPGLCLLPTCDGNDRIEPFAFQKLLDVLKSHFGLILVDAGAYDEGTTRSLAGICSSVYLTLRLNHTTKARARAAERQIKTGGGKLAGSLLVYSAT